MNRFKHESGQTTEIELERVIEPLASYICAADQPRAVLMSALAVLFNEVDQIYRAANAQIAIFSGESVVMKYMLLIYIDEQVLTEPVREHCYEESTQLCHELSARGQYLAANPLYPTATATSVRVRDGNPLITDGPFAETREQLGGYFLIEAKDLDEAIAVAARIPGVRMGTVEIRPVLEIRGLPTVS